MNVLLVNPLCRLAYALPLGLGYIASVLREEGHNVKILDINGLKYSPEEVEKKIHELEFDIVGIGGLTSTYKYVKWLAKIFKKHKPHVPIVAGNMVSTAHPELLLKHSDVDIAVIDEGEFTFKELVRAIDHGRDLKEINGIFYKNNNGDIMKTLPRERIAELDSLPFPAWDLFPMETYLNNSTQSPVRFGLRTINISTVRGCPYDCTFCSRPFGRQVYARSAKSIVNEIQELRKKYGVEYIIFGDDLSLFNEKRVLEICDMMMLENIDVKWQAAGRVNLVNDNLLKKMHQAGCVQLSYGFESGSQAVLDKMNKHVNVREAEEAIKMTRKAKINITGSFIFGMPGETKDTIQETLDFIKRTRLPLYRFFYATPYPKTELYKIAKKMGRFPQDEDKYLESLGEMRETFLVNFTDFSDKELVRLKNLAELKARKSLGFKFWIEEFIENWQRRYVVFRLDVKNSGIISAAKMVFLKLLRKLNKNEEARPI